MNALMPNRSFWSTWGWNNRLEQVQHLTNFVYVCVDTICSLLGQHLPNLAYVEDSDDEQPGRGQRRKGANGRRGQHVYDFRHRFVDPGGHGGLVLPSGVGKGDGWDGAALLGAHRHATGKYPGYTTYTGGSPEYKAITNAQPHEQLEPLPSDHKLRRLIVNPNRYDTSYDLIYELVMFNLLCGVSYLWAVPNSYGIPAELWVLPAHWVWPRGSNGGTVDPAYQHLVEWYEVRPFGAAGGGYGMVRIPADEVLAFTMKSPLSKIDGWSKLTACSQWIDVSESMDRSAWAQMQNQGMPSMFIELGEAYADADDNQTARIEAKFAQKLGGEYNVGRPFVGKPGMKMTPLNWSPESMMYPQMSESYRDKVLGAFHLSKVAVGMMDDMTYGSILAALAHTWIHCLNPLAASIGQRLTKELAPRFTDPGYRKWLKEGGVWLDGQNDNVLFSSRSKSGYVRDASGKRRISTDHEEEQGKEIRVWWPDGSPPDPQQVNADLAVDLANALITPNEARAIRGRPPYELGGDNPLVQGPGGLMPLPINVEEDMEELGELIGEFNMAVQPGKEEPKPGMEGAPGTEGLPPAEEDEAGQAPGSGAGGEPTLEELSGEEPEGLSPAVEQPNGKPSKGLAKGRGMLDPVSLFTVSVSPLVYGIRFNGEDTGWRNGSKTQTLAEMARLRDKTDYGKPSKSVRWVRRKETCTPGHTAARDSCTPARRNPGGTKPDSRGEDAPPSPKRIVGVVANYLGVQPQFTSFKVMTSGEFDRKFGSPDDAIHGGVAAIRTNDGAIYVKQGYESDGLHEMTHAAGFLEEGVNEYTNEGVTQAATEEMAKESGTEVRQTYSDEVNYVRNYLIPATGLSPQQFFRGYAGAKDKGEYLVDAIWSANGDKFVDEVDWGSNPRAAMLKEIPRALGPIPQLTYLVDELGVGKAKSSKSWYSRLSGNGRIKQAAPQGPVAAGLAVVAGDTGRVLLLQRQLDEGDPNSGKWEFPSGHIDQGEHPLEAAVREWCEEVGHVLPPGQLDGEGWVSGNGKYAGYVYRVASEDVLDHAARKVDADPSSGGWAAVAWVDPEDMANHNLRPALLGDLDDVLEEVQ